MPSSARSNWIVGAAVGALALLIYWLTLAPTITWRNDGADSGDLVTAAFTLGIPHPSGYPLYTLLAAAFARLPFAEPARGVNLFSALCAAGAVVLFYIAARALAETNLAKVTNLRKDGFEARFIAASVALVVAFMPLFWAQAVLAEVYAFNALLVAVLLAILSSSAFSRIPVSSGNLAERGGTNWRVWLCAAIFGLGLAHHLSIMLLVPSALLLLRGLPRTRNDILRALVVFLAPLLLYLYLPLRARADPPINWGDPRTLENFWWTISAAPYRPYLFNFAFGDLGARVAVAARELFVQFNGWGVALGLWGVAQMWTRARRQCLAFALGFILIAAYSIVYVTRDSFVYLIPALMLFAGWIAFGLADLARRFSRAWMRGALIGVLLLLPGYNLIANFAAHDLSRDRQAFDYARTIFAHAPNDALILADGDAHLFALQYYRYVIAPDARVDVVSAELLQYDWYYAKISRARVLGARASEYGARLAQIVETNLNAGRAVYTTAQGGWFAGYKIQPEGEMFRIVERRR
ncbi:MAG: DUF2723 domain-containing protein [Chloroflexota bacterium]